MKKFSFWMFAAIMTICCATTMLTSCKILYIENGRHNDAIDTWNFSERNQLFQWLASLGFNL